VDEIAIERRGARAGTAETTAFMTGQKKILIFSTAGGTGRSYHADLSQPNQDRRVHYLLEPGWRADAAVQGLGRTHRTNQASAPLFKPVVTDVKGEKRFSSTIARKLDSLGALTKGERKTGGQGLFRPEDNLESEEAKDALRLFIAMVRNGKIEAVPCAQFEEMTGLSLRNSDGTDKIEGVPIRQFLNRILALPIEVQNVVFEHFERLIANRIEAAREAGTLDLGMEVLTAENMTVASDDLLTTERLSGAETRLVQIERKQRVHIRSADEMLQRFQTDRFMVNKQTGKAAVIIPWDSWTHADGSTVRRVRLLRPVEKLDSCMSVPDFEKSLWREVTDGAFRRVWDEEGSSLPRMETDRFALVTGLILPLWPLLPKEGSQVYRLTTDCGRTLLGRKVEMDVAAKLSETFGKELVELSPEDIVRAVFEDREPQIGKLKLRKARVMDDVRIEVMGWGTQDADALRAAGCFAELIAYQTRFFVPKDRDLRGEVIGRLQTRFGSTVSVS
jgi:hypothetical protein